MKRLTLALSLFLFITLKALTQDITFNHLTTDHGLSQISVNALYEDERGLIWIGTREGLNCYASNLITTYKLQKNNPNSLFCNNVLRITGDRRGKIYLLCTEGISEYDMKEDKFSTLLHAVDIGAICYQNQLLIGHNNEICIYDKSKKEFDCFYRFDKKSVVITSLFYDNKGLLWIGTMNDGVFTLEKESNSTFTLNHVVNRGNIISIYQDSDDDIWIGTWSHGLYQIKNKKVFIHLNDPANEKSISNNFVRMCCEDNQGHIWIGTYLGLERYDKRTREFTHYTATETPDGLSHASIWCIIKDKQGTLWMGTYFGGLNYFNPEYKIYTQYKASENEKDGLSSPIVGKMIEDDKNNLWICTEGGGVNVYNRKTKEFKWYKHHPGQNSISENNVKAIHYDATKNIMWIGTHLGGLNKLDLNTGRFTYYLYDENDTTSIPSNIVKDIVPYQDYLVIATENGVRLFDPSNGKCRRLFEKSPESLLVKNTADLLIDRDGLLWMGVIGEGVFTYNFETKVLKNYRHDPRVPASISNNNINSIAQDAYNNIWICTSGSGLDLYRPETDDFRNFDVEKNGLLSDCVYEVRNSAFGKLLVITNQGFSRFDYATERFYNHNIENGFPLTTINENALYLTRDGEVFLGGVKGMVSFYEKDLDFTKKSYNIILSRLFVNGTEVTANDEFDLLKYSIASTKKITLKHNHSVFTIEYVTTNYVPANKDEIIYKLEGFSDEWISAREQQAITYTNLNPGDYTLIIKSNDKENPYAAEARLQITVLPPFYRSVYAYIFYLLSATGILYFLIKSYNDRIKLRESLKYEQKHIEDIERLNQSKLRFFTNISHEFRTPLTLIIGQLEMLLQINTFTPSVYNRILKVYKSGVQLKELISELLDFRKQEQGHMKIKVSEHNIVDFLYENFLLFLEQASSKQINLKFNKQADELMVWYDQKQMQKVVNNLLSNAFKHTPQEGTIQINIRREEQEAIIEIKDTGVGIAAKDIDKIFERFYQTESIESLSDTGTGIGLALTKGIIELHHGRIEVESEVSKGTTFRVRLLLGAEHFDEEQKVSNQECAVKDSFINKEKQELVFEQEALIDTLDKQSKNAKILIVEDNESLLEMLVNIFEPFYEVITAGDGEEGLERVKSELPDIILSDVLMPKMSGTEMCKHLKGDIETCHIPIVLLTARTAIEHNLEGLRLGADDYITKPFDVNILISRCNNLINNRIVLKEKFSKQPEVSPHMLATNTLDKKLLDKAMNIIEENIDNTEFNMNIFAREMGMARTNLFAKIKAITGQTPNDFISIIRLKKAAFLLRNNPELNITEIADRTGFSSSRYFSKCFKNVYHVTPMTYRNGDNKADEKEEPE